MFASLFFVTLLDLSVTPCVAFESKFYFCSDDDLEFSELNSTIAKADFTIDCDSLEATKISVRHHHKRSNEVTDIQCTKVDAFEYLKNRGEKNLLVIWFGKIIWREPENQKQLLKEFEEFVNELGFRRVLILGGSAFGTQVLKDTEEDKRNNSRLAFKPGYYYMDPKCYLSPELHSTLGEADLTIACIGPDEIDIGIQKEEPDGLKTIYFKPRELSYYLQGQKHKRLLVIRFTAALINSGDQKLRALIDKYRAFVANLGYKRVLIVGDHAVGTELLYDSYQTDSDSYNQR